MWYAKAAQQGYARAQNNLGLMYEIGNGVAQDYAHAVTLYTSAAKQGYANAQFSLSIMYNNGSGVVQDFVLAHMWVNIAAANGYENASSFRDTVGNKLTQIDVSKAQQMASKCLASNYESCGY